MKHSTKKVIDNLIERYPCLACCPVQAALEEVIACYNRKNKILVCGNGGSAADSLHIVGELMKGFLLPRKLGQKKQELIKAMFPDTAQYLINNLQEPLAAISLVSEIALLSAYANDQASDLIFAQQILGHGNTGDVLIAISTSGNSKNVIYGAQMAKIQGMKIIAFTGKTGGKLNDLADILINVPFEETYVIQEYHLPIYHALCAAVENEFFMEEVH